GTMIEVANVAEMNVYQVVDQNYGGRWGRITFTLANGQEVTLDIRGHMRFAVRVGTGSWSPVLNAEMRIENPVLRVFPNGELEIEGVPMSVVDVHSVSTGPVIYHYRLAGNRWRRRDTDFSTRRERTGRGTEGAQALRAGELTGLDRIERAFRERVRHDRLRQDAWTDPRGEVRQLYLAEEYGQVVARAVAHLFGGSQRQTALNIQGTFLDRLYAASSPFNTRSARFLVLNGYANLLLQQATPEDPSLVLGLLPALSRHLGQANRYPFLDHAGHLRLRRLAEAQLQAGNRTAALTLFQFGAGTWTSGETRLLPGRVQGDTYVVTTPTGNMPLELVMDGQRREYEGLPASDSAVARMRARQIGFATQWQARAQSLGVFTPQELAAVPPPPEVMQRYFTARYNGQMPAQFGALRTELQEYMAVAFLHTVIDVPDALRVWNSVQLPVSADSRWAGDCGVMTRAALHMLQGVAGLEFVPVSSDRHVRLLVLADSGRQGLLESNQAVHALEPGPNFDTRVRRTIARHRDLQVLHNMPAPFTLGDPVTSTTGTDIDQAFETSEQGAEARLPAADPSLYATGQQTRPIIHRFDDYRVRRQELFSDWVHDYDPTNPDERQAMDRRRQALAAEQQQLEQDINGVSTGSPAMQRFIGQMRDRIRFGREFLHGQDPAPPPFVIHTPSP
ncbi:MAG: hypothetical protein ACYS8I_10280, partial [Planctomycetota bacterium]